MLSCVLVLIGRASSDAPKQVGSWRKRPSPCSGASTRPLPPFQATYAMGGLKLRKKKSAGVVEVPEFETPKAGFEVIEHDKTGNVQRRWLHAADNRVTQILDNGNSNGFLSRSLREWRNVLSDSFLPVGFPHSVSGDYLAYQTYDSLQAFFSTITSLLANRALLQGLGVGDANSSATYAMMLTILKDAMSRVATIVFAHRFGLRIEPDAKRYRFLADLFNDTAFFLELWSPYLGSWGKVAALSLGEALRALCGVAAGASKAALSVHFAKHDNLAELNAKEASQETAVGLIGLLVGTVVVKCVEDHQQVVYLTILLVFAHLLMNYLGVRNVIMDNFNRQRSGIVVAEYLETGKILCPTEVAQRECILFPDLAIHCPLTGGTAHIEFALNYRHAIRSSFGHSFFVVQRETDLTSLSLDSSGTRLHIKLLLCKDARPIDALTTWFEAILVARSLDDKTSVLFPRKATDYVATTISELHAWAGELKSHGKSVFNEEFWSKIVAAGWDIDTQLLETSAPVRLSIRHPDRKDE
ncbi:RUS family member 1 [Paramyrothecium foliicola]|nr:RUS family member 1 [Paramyrothecium foliicola]